MCKIYADPCKIWNGKGLCKVRGLEEREFSHWHFLLLSLHSNKKLSHKRKIRKCPWDWIHFDGVFVSEEVPVCLNPPLAACPLRELKKDNKDRKDRSASVGHSLCTELRSEAPPSQRVTTPTWVPPAGRQGTSSGGTSPGGAETWAFTLRCSPQGIRSPASHGDRLPCSLKPGFLNQSSSSQHP